MQCQLARVIEGEHVSEDYRGWYLWVKVGAPTMERSAHFETQVPVAPCLQYQSPYRHHGRAMLAPAECVELLPVAADIPERSFDEWIKTGGEPSPQEGLA